MDGCVSGAPDVAAEPSLLLLLLSTRNHNFTLTCRQPPGGSRPPVAGAATQGGRHRARFNWHHMAGKGDGGVWAGAGQGVGDAPSPCLADPQPTKVWASRARSGSGWCSQGQAGGETAPTPKASSFHTNEQHLSRLDLSEHGWNHRRNIKRTLTEHQRNINGK